MSDESFATDIMGDLYPYKDRFASYPELPSQGRSPGDIEAELKTIAGEENKLWEGGTVSGTMYHGGREHYDFLNRVFSLFSHANLLQRDLVPSGTKFESEIVAMTAAMLNSQAAKALNPEDEVCGTVTSGGTESIYNAVYVYREWGRDAKDIDAPEMVVPSTLHPAFHKAAHYLGVKMVTVPVDEQYEADVAAMREAITDQTVAIAGSSGTYPHGVIDPIPDLSDLAQEHGLGLHVDGCLGGFILPWVEKLGYEIPAFDFRVPGVTSMSCDTHKFGYGLKGTSVVLYRRPSLRRYQFWAKTDWEGGVYASPTVQGSRSAGLTAATWAAMVSMGETGYMKAARAIMNTADTIRAGIAEIPAIKILGKSTFLIAMASDQVDIYHVNDYLASQGWRMNGCQNPPGFHFCITLPNTRPGLAEAFVEDLRAGVDYAKDPPYDFAKSGALYGLAGTDFGQAMLEQGLLEWIEATYEGV